MQHPTGKAPSKVALVAAGPSKIEWLNLMASAAIEGPIVDEVWGINTVGRGLNVDVTFAMDDYRKFIGHNPSCCLFYEDPGHPLITCVAHPKCPQAVTYPLAEVLSLKGARGDYLNHTVSYAIAYAIVIGVKELLIFGADYISTAIPYATGFDNQQGAARYLAGAAYWIGQAEARGMDVVICPTSPLLDADLHESQKFYGYLMKPVIRRGYADDGKVVPIEKAAG